MPGQHVLSIPEKTERSAKVQQKEHSQSWNPIRWPKTKQSFNRTETISNQQVWPRKRPPPGKCSTESKFLCQNCAINPWHFSWFVQWLIGHPKTRSYATWFSNSPRFYSGKTPQSPDNDAFQNRPSTEIGEIPWAWTAWAVP